MITELAKILPKFSEASHIRCFLHIINLVAKLILKQFDVPKKREDEDLDDAEQELRDLAGDLELKEWQTAEAMDKQQINRDTGLGAEMDNDIDGWVDKMLLLSPAEQARVKEDIRPVKLVLVKVNIDHTQEYCTYMH